MPYKYSAAALFFSAFLFAQPPSSPQQAAIDRISADSLRGNLSFLASNALEGRDTPSRGLTVAAEFIASRFRQIGLQPLAPKYLQMADFVTVTPKLDDFRLTLLAGGEELHLTSQEAGVHSLQGLDIAQTPVLHGPAAIPGAVVAVESRTFPTDASLNPIRAVRPALILVVSERGHEAPDPWRSDAEDGAIPVIRVFSEDAAAALAQRRPMTISVHLSPPVRRDAKVANVVGLVPGSDPSLRNQYVIVSAHYDHLGIEGDRIYPGANDDGSGVVSVIEIAAAFASLATPPKRGIIFIAFFGEEEGLFGSQYYARHPLEPLRATVANINLEQLGRTDERDGPEVNAFAFTGPSYSNLPAIMTAAAKTQGIAVYRKRDADSFFDRSDNYSLAEAGVVAHTLVVAFEYPDYHAPGDTWDKIDYTNMARVDRAIAAGVLRIADSPTPPRSTR